MSKARQALALSKGNNPSERKVTNAKGAKIPVRVTAWKEVGRLQGSRGDSGRVAAPHKTNARNTQIHDPKLDSYIKTAFKKQEHY